MRITYFCKPTFYFLRGLEHLHGCPQAWFTTVTNDIIWSLHNKVAKCYTHLQSFYDKCKQQNNMEKKLYLCIKKCTSSMSSYRNIADLLNYTKMKKGWSLIEWPAPAFSSPWMPFLLNPSEVPAFLWEELWLNRSEDAPWAKGESRHLLSKESNLRELLWLKSLGKRTTKPQ